jgi:hypothetical protein
MCAMGSADRKSSMDILYGIMKKYAIPLEVGGNHENDYLRAKYAYLKLL